MNLKVSCILATGNRRAFLRQAIRYFMRQTYENKELIIVDDSQQSAVDLVPDNAPIRYIKLDTSTLLGRKLNLGVEAASGRIIQKIDDDDYYQPQFLTTTVGALKGRDPQRAIAGLDGFLVLIAASGVLTFSGYGWFAGGTLCFYRELWQQQPFRSVPRAVDWWFLKDHDLERIKIREPELYILLRHQTGHAWTKMGKTDVTEYFSRRPPYRKPLRAVIPAEDLTFYDGLLQRSRV